MVVDSKKLITVELEYSEAFAIKQFLELGLRELNLMGQEPYSKKASILVNKLSDAGVQ